MKKIGWINIVRSLCMLLVYWNHSEYFSNNYYYYFDRLYSPLFVNSFFCVSGYLLFKKQLSLPIIQMKCFLASEGNLLMNVVYKLVIPSIIFSCIIFFPKFYLRGIDIDVKQFLIHTILGRAMWFTWALAVAELLLIVFILKIKKLLFYFFYGILFWAVSYFFFLNNVLILGDQYIPWQYKSAMAAVLFLVLGGIYWRYEDFIDRLLGGWRLICVIALYVILALTVKDNTAVNLGYLTPKALLLDIIGVYVFFRICKKISLNPFFSYWGSHSIGLYFFCGAIPNVIALILGKFMFDSSLLTLCIFVISLAIAMVIVYLLDRYMSFLFDIRMLEKKKST